MIAHEFGYPTVKPLVLGSCYTQAVEVAPNQIRSNVVELAGTQAVQQTVEQVKQSAAA